MATYEVRMRPQGKVLARYKHSRSRVTFIMGPLGSGKTYESCEKLFNLMCEQRPNKRKERKSRWYAIRNTYPDLTTTTIKDWMELFGEFGRYTAGGMEPPTHRLQFMLNDGTVVKSELVFLALDRPDAVKRLRGSQVTGFWLNEVKELAKAVVDMCDLRHGRYPSKMDGGPTWHGMIGDTNAPDDDHWYYNLAEEVQPEGWEFFRQPGGVIRVGDRWEENPEAENLNNLPAGYYKSGMEGKSYDWVNVNLGNNYGSVFDGKPIYPEWRDSLHVASHDLAPYKGVPLILSWDFGLTPACIISQLTKRGQWRVLDELVAENMGIRQFARTVVVPHMANHYAGMDIEVTGDPAGVNRSEADEKTCFDELEAAGLRAEPARTNDFTARREAVAGFLTRLVDGEPAFLLSPRCKMLRKGFNGGYKYRRLQVVGDERYTDTADKNRYSHPHDALQYGGLRVEMPVLTVSRKTASAYRRSPTRRRSANRAGY